MDGGHALEGGKCLDGFSNFLLSDAQIVNTLQIDPEFGAGAEKMRQAQGRVGRDVASSVQNLGNAMVGTRNWRASEAALMLSSFNSSAKCSPGWITSSGMSFPFVVPFLRATAS